MLKEFCLTSTLQGLKYFYLFPGTFSRIYWAINLIALTTLATFLTLDLWNRFMEMPTTISIENQFALMTDIVFPAVTFCSPNQLSRSRKQHLLSTLIDRPSDISEQDLSDAIDQLMSFYEDISIDTSKLLKLQRTLDLNRYNLDSVLMTIPQQCDSMIKVCYFAGVLYTNCSDLFTPILTPFGYCCSFNNYYSTVRHNRNAHFVPEGVKYYGRGTGLSTLLDFSIEDAEPVGLMQHAAARVFVHDADEYPPQEDMTLVPSSVETYYFLKAIYTNASEDVGLLPKESRDCVFDKEESLRYFDAYTNSDCLTECFLNATINECDCVPIYVPRSAGKRRCQLIDLPCLIRSRENLNEKWEQLSDCVCPRDCSDLQYKVSISVSNMDALEHVMHGAYGNIKKEGSKTIIHIMFQDQFYVRQKQETVTSSVVIMSNLGGVFGLCLGCSVISLVEIFYLVIKVIGRRINHKRKELLRIRAKIIKKKRRAKAKVELLQTFP